MWKSICFYLDVTSLLLPETSSIHCTWFLNTQSKGMRWWQRVKFECGVMWCWL
jgi:hypothetical protein